jgi:phosphoribosylformylglycinamidine synthase
MRNAGLKFICRPVTLTVATTDSAFTGGYHAGQTLRVPVAHHDGNYTAGDDLLAQLRDEDRIAFTYAEPVNGSAGDIAGVLSENRRVLGMMPHPERAAEDAHGSTDGRQIFAGLVGALTDA